MKKDIQPKIYTEAVVTCACGSKFTTISTLPSISVDICSSCHPFYTGQRRFVDTERRIDKFNKKILKAEEKKKEVAVIKKAKEARNKAAAKTAKASK
jgi:large subunit ribosomal protein L31